MFKKTKKENEKGNRRKKRKETKKKKEKRKFHETKMKIIVIVFKREIWLKLKIILALIVIGSDKPINRRIDVNSLGGHIYVV